MNELVTVLLYVGAIGLLAIGIAGVVLSCHLFRIVLALSIAESGGNLLLVLTGFRWDAAAPIIEGASQGVIVNLTDRRLAVEWKKGAVDPAALIDRLAELGYKAYPFEPVRAELVEAEQSRFLLRCLGVAAFAAMNVMMLSIPVWSGNVSDMLPEQRDFFHWLSALIALAGISAGWLQRKELLEAFEGAGVVAILAGHSHTTLANRWKGIQIATAETTSKNFDQRPFGFQVWHVRPGKEPWHEVDPLLIGKQTIRRIDMTKIS